MNAKVLSAVFLCGCSGCVCTSGQDGLSSGFDGSERSMICLRAAKPLRASKQGGVCTAHRGPSLTCVVLSTVVWMLSNWRGLKPDHLNS